jgi:hypothetical protein
MSLQYGRGLTAVVVSLFVGLLMACVYGHLTVAASRLTVVSTNDRVRGDEPYFATIRFQAAYGSAGSTVVVVEDSLTTLGSRLRSGESVVPRDTVGRHDFGVLPVLDRADIDQGNAPGVGGVFYLMMEEDHGGKSAVRAAVQARAALLRELLAAHVEQASWGPFALPQSLAAIQEGLVLGEDGAGGGCGLLNTRACRFFRSRLGDDLIGFNGVIYAGISPAYFATLEPGWRALANALGTPWPDCGSAETPICPVATRAHLLEFQGEDALYRLAVDTTFQP